MSAYTAALAAARATRSQAQDALALAVGQTEPLDAELVRMMRDKMPQRYAECERQVAEIAATIPALRAAVEAARAAEDLLSADACFRCQGTGLYQAPTSHYQNGKPICFTCKGDGRSAKARRRAVS